MNSLLGLTTILAGSETVAMTALTQYAKSSNPVYMAIGALIYGIVIPFTMTNSVNFAGIGTVNFMWNIITTITMIVIGHYWFGDKMSHLHIISLLLGLGSLTVLYLAEL